MSNQNQRMAFFAQPNNAEYLNQNGHVWTPSPTYVDPHILNSAFSGEYYNKQWGSAVSPKNNGKNKRKN
jgi:hypothetical protein